MRAGLLLLVVALLGAGLPSVAAQTPSPTDNTFYGHVDCGSSTFGISVVAESPGTNCGTGEGTSYTWVFPEDPPIDVDLNLEEGADVPMWVWIGSNTHAGRVTVTSTIYAGDTVVAEAEGTAEYAGVVTSYVEVAMTGTALVGQLTEPLRWEVTASGAFSSVFMRFEEGRWSRFQLPITGVGGGPIEDDPVPSVVYENLTSPPDLNLEFANTTSETRVYNWTQAGGSGELAYNFTGNGTVSVTVVDGNASVVANEALTGTGVVRFSGATGNWSMVVDLENVTGALQLRIQEPTNVDPSNPGGETNTTTTTTDDAGVEEESPGFEVAALLALLGAVAAMARRRR